MATKTGLQPLRATKRTDFSASEWSSMVDFCMANKERFTVAGGVDSAMVEKEMLERQITTNAHATYQALAAAGIKWR